MAKVELDLEEYEALKAERNHANAQRDEWETKYKALTKSVDTFIFQSDVVLEFIPQNLDEMLLIKISTRKFDDYDNKLLGAFKHRANLIKKQGRLY